TYYPKAQKAALASYWPQRKQLSKYEIMKKLTYFNFVLKQLHYAKIRV
ncbi:MAG: hypothetical protein ACD_67C00239G0004, partial [uncultured bacterium]